MQITNKIKKQAIASNFVRKVLPDLNLTEEEKIKLKEAIKNDIL